MKGKKTITTINNSTVNQYGTDYNITFTQVVNPTNIFRPFLSFADLKIKFSTFGAYIRIYSYPASSTQFVLRVF